MTLLFCDIMFHQIDNIVPPDERLTYSEVREHAK